MLRLNSPKKCIGPKLSLQVCILRRRHSRATGNLSAIYQQFIRPFSADEFEDNFKVLCLLRFQRPIMRTSIQFIANWNCWETYFKHQRCSSTQHFAQKPISPIQCTVLNLPLQWIYAYMLLFQQCKGV